MSTATEPTTAPAAKKSSKGAKVLYVVVALVFAAAGAIVPMVFDVKAMMGKSASHDEHATAKPAKEPKTISIPFGDAVVNLSEDRMQRYLRIKLVLVVDEEHEKTATERITAKKAEMKSWLISHLCGKTLKDIAGTVGYNRTQREIFERFEDILYPAGHGHLKNVLFEEYVVQ